MKFSPLHRFINLDRIRNQIKLITKKKMIEQGDEFDAMFGARGDNENEASRRAKTEFLT